MKTRFLSLVGILILAIILTSSTANAPISAPAQTSAAPATATTSSAAGKPSAAPPSSTAATAGKSGGVLKIINSHAPGGQWGKLSITSG